MTSAKYPLTEEELERLMAIERDKDAVGKASQKLAGEIRALEDKVKGEEITFWSEMLAARGLDGNAPASVDLNTGELVVEDPDLEYLRRWNPALALRH